MSIENVKDKCVGCGVCNQVCPKNAIDMVYSEDGFLYPQINSQLCIDCDLCEKKCPTSNDINWQSTIKAYYGRSTDAEIVSKSSSGGIFSVLADKVLELNGVVFGAAFDSRTKKVIYTSTEEVDLEQLRRSKYVESYVNDSFEKTKKYLENGRIVLFVGMPCHIVALKLFLGKNYDNLITCDFICGGAASPVNFIEHLKFIEKKYGSEIIDVNFRPKLYGWKEHSIKIDFKNGKSYKNYAHLDTYFRGFISEGALKRISCTDCHFRSNHASDIILADFWGFKQVPGLVDDDKGLSLVVTNSEKGEKFLRDIPSENISMKEIPLEYAQYNFNPNKNTAKTRKNKEIFMREYRKYGFEKAARKTYMKNCFAIRLKKLIKSIIRG